MNNLAIAISFLFLFFNESSGQSSQKFTVGLMVGPGFSSRMLNGDDGTGHLNLFEIPEVGKFSYAGGISVGYLVSENLELRSGLGYSNLDYATEKKELIFGDCIAQMQIDPDYQCDDFVKFKYDFHFLNVPLSLRYRFSKSYFLQSGLLLKFLVKHQEKRTLKENGVVNVQKNDLEFQG